MTQTVTIDLDARSYDVVIGDKALDAAMDQLAGLLPRKRAFVITDEAVAPLHLAGLAARLEHRGIAIEPMIVPAGESAKKLDVVMGIVDSLLEARIERSEPVIALGGGVVGDMTGFAAAITKRGTKFVQIPTTLLAQVDSSVGGKTGINTRQGKNLVGAFHQPDLVIADTAYLATLPEREVRAGYAEIIKAALIGDAGMFDRLEARGAAALEADNLTASIADAVRFKAAIVAEDEREARRRALLNLGHTFGHAFEADAPPGVLRHGEAVAAGIGLAFEYSARLGHCSAEDARRVREHLRLTGLPDGPKTLAHTDWNAASLVERMRGDKKNSGGKITLILARGIGNAYIETATQEDDLREFMETSLK